jgi:hypothetical protein
MLTQVELKVGQSDSFVVFDTEHNILSIQQATYLYP